MLERMMDKMDDAWMEFWDFEFDRLFEDSTFLDAPMWFKLVYAPIAIIRIAILGK